MKFLTTFLHTRFICLLVLGVSTLLAVNPAWSQEQEQEQAEPDIEVVVTADRVETETTKIPAHVTVITAEQLKAKGKATVVDALEELAGVSFRSTSGNPAQAEVSMRGFGENSHGRVLVLLDGRKLNQPDMASINWLQIPIENVERIEVVRGGNSVLYGDHAVGGVINIITKKGSQDVKLNAFTSGGSFWDNQERLGVTGMIGPFDLVINAEHTGSEGYRDHSALESIGAGLELGVDITDSLYSSLTLSYEWLACEFPGYLTKEDMEEDPTQSSGDTETENHHLNNMITFKALLGEWGQFQVDTFYNVKISQDDIPSWASFSNKYFHSLGTSPRLNADFLLLGFENSLTVGADLSWNILDFQRYADASRGTKECSRLITKNSYGFYVNNEFSLLDTLHFNAGLRYEMASIATFTRLGIDIDDEKFHPALVWNAGVVWEFLPKSKLYGRFERVYHYPFIDEQVSFWGYISDNFNMDLEAEQGYNIETGTEITLFERIINLKLNLFYVELEDEIAYNPDTSANENMPRTRRIGGEAGVEVNIEDFLIISGNYTYTYATFIAGDNESKFIPLVPEHDAFVEVTFNIPLGFSLGSSLNYRGACYTGSDYSNTQEKLADHFLWNGFLKYIPDFIPGKLQIMFHIENILNKCYATAAYYNSWTGITAYYPEPGISWKISVSYGLEL